MKNLTLKHAVHTPFSIGWTISRKLSKRTINCCGEIKHIYKIENKKLIRGLKILSEVKQEICEDGKANVVTGINIKETFRPIIFAMSHIGKFDIETVAEFLPHFFLLSGDDENLHSTSSGKLLEMHGIIYFDMEDTQDKRNVKEVIKKVLSSGNNVLWCVESTWNFSENQLIQPCPYGIIEVAEKTGALILPIGVQQFNDNNFSVKFGQTIDPIEIRKEYYLNSIKMKQESIEIVRSAMTTEVYSIIESQGINKRTNIDKQIHYDYVKNRLSEWTFTFDDVEKKKFNPSYIIPNKETNFIIKRKFQPPFNKPLIFFQYETFNHIEKINELPYILNKKFNK